MRLVFAGTSDFACVSLKNLLKAKHDISLILTREDQKVGRGMKLIFNPVKKLGLKYGIKILQPKTLDVNTSFNSELKNVYEHLMLIKPDAIIVAAYGLILPKWILNFPRYGCINVHASLLPRWRGAAPIHRAIESGDKITGITIIQMDTGMDTGDILFQSFVPIFKDQNLKELHDILALEGGYAICNVLQRLLTGDLKPKPQSISGITYAKKIKKSESLLDCSMDAEILARRIRAFYPSPGTVIYLENISNPLKIWRAQVLNEQTNVLPGRIQKIGKFGIDIATGKGILRLLEIQKPGGKRQKVCDFIQGWKM
ncbi:MAG: methionyl-tRNA formyltransferase [Bordetella sp.]|nr:MAG: methionyl-tRNA formyltransferase [Bordetella sp.]